MPRSIVRLLLTVLLFTPACAIAQPLSASLGAAHYVLVYKVPYSRAAEVLKQDFEFKDPLQFGPAVDSFDYRERSAARLPRGLYLMVYAQGSTVRQGLLMKTGLDAQLLEAGKKFGIRLMDSLRNDLPGAKVWTPKAEASYDTVWGCYRFPKRLKQSLVWLAYQGDTSLYTYARGAFSRISNWGMGQNDNYMVTSQPLYKPGDTLRLKAWVVNGRGKPLKRRLYLSMREGWSYSRGQYLRKAVEIKPLSPGAYVYDSPLGDSLKTDVRYEIELHRRRRLSSRIVLSHNIRVEDYRLDRITFTARTDTSLFQGKDSVILHARAISSSGQPVMDGEVRLSLSILNIDTIYQPRYKCAKEVLVKKYNLDYKGELRLALPDSLFPNGRLAYRADLVFLNANGERKEKFLTFTYDRRERHVEFKQRHDSLVADLLEEGMPVRGTGLLDIEFFGRENEVKIISLPLRMPLPPNVYKATLTSLGREHVLNVYAEAFNNERPELWWEYKNDSLYAGLHRQTGEPIRYVLYKNGKPLAEAMSRQDTLVSMPVGKREKFDINYWYKAGGMISEKRMALTQKEDQLEVKVMHPQKVAPGGVAPLAIQVSNAKGEPVPQANLTVVAYSAEFGSNEPKINPPAVIRRGGLKKVNRHVFHKAGGKRSLQLNQAWMNRLGLDTQLWYQFVNSPDALVYQYEALDENADYAEFQPFVLRDEELAPIKKLVMNSWLMAEHLGSGPLPCVRTYEGIHKVVILTDEEEITLDSIEVIGRQKLMLAIRTDIPAEGVHIQKLKRGKKEKEAQVMPKGFIMALENIEDVSWLLVWQSGRMLQVHPYDYQRAFVHLVNSYDSVHYWQLDKYETVFPAMPDASVKVRANLVQVEKQDFTFYYDTRHNRPIPIEAMRQYAHTYDTSVLRPFRAMAAEKSKKEAYQAKSTTQVRSCYAGKVKAAWQYSLPVDKAAPEKLMPLEPCHTFYLPEGKHRVVYMDTTGQLWRSPVFSVNPDSLYYFAWQPADLEKMELATAKPGAIAWRGRITGFPVRSYYMPTLSMYSGELKVDEVYIGPGGYFLGKPLPAGDYRMELSIKNPAVSPKTITLDKKHAWINWEIPLDAGELANMSPKYFPYYRGGRALKYKWKKDINAYSGWQYNDSRWGGFERYNADDPYMSYEDMEDLNSFRGNVYRRSGLADLNPSGKMRLEDGIINYDYEGIERGYFKGLEYNTLDSDKNEDNFNTEAYLVGAYAFDSGPGHPRAEGGQEDAFTRNGLLPTAAALRRNFRDYAIWEPNLLTDMSGHVSALAHYPDNITGWQGFVLAADNKRREGVAKFTSLAQRQFAAELAMPAYLLQGDSLQAIAKVLNYTPDSFAAKISFSAPGRPEWTTQTGVRHMRLDRHSVTVPLKGDTADFTFSATLDNGYRDGELRRIPVRNVGVEELAGSFIVAQGVDTSIRLHFDTTKGPVHIFAAATEAQMLIRSLNELLDYPHSCNEQTMSKLRGLIALNELRQAQGKAKTNEKLINKLQRKLTDAQNPDGSWGWYENARTNLDVTLYIAPLLYKEGNGYYNYRATAMNYLRKALDTASSLTKVEVLLALKQIDKSAGQGLFKTITYATLDTFHRLQYLRIKQLEGIPVTAAEVLALAKPGKPAGIRFGAESMDFYRNQVPATLLAYRILRQVGGQEAALRDIRSWLWFGSQCKGWRNTVETAEVLATLFPEMKNELQKKEQPQLLVSADKGVKSAAASAFPYNAQLSATGDIVLQKTGSAPLYIAAWQETWEPNPKPVAGAFKLNSHWETLKGKPVTALEGGEPVVLVTEVEVTQTAHYTLVEVPIPASCVYYGEQTSGGICTHRELRQGKACFYYEKLEPGKYTLRIGLQPRFSGRFTQNPVQAGLLYFPGLEAHTEVRKVEVGEK